MSQLSKSSFDTQYANASGSFLTNGIRSITALIMRTFSLDLKDSTMFLTDNFIDEDSFASDSATKAPSQQSTKAYIASVLGTGHATFYDNTTNTNSGGTAETILTIPIATGKIVGIHAKIINEWVSGSAGAGNGGFVYKIATYKNVSGTITQIGSTSTIHSSVTGASVPTLTLTISGTNVLVQAQASSGEVYNVRGIAQVEGI